MYEIFWMIVRRVLDECWMIVRRVLDKCWTTVGRVLDKFWTCVGRVFNTYGINMRYLMNSLRIESIGGFYLRAFVECLSSVCQVSRQTPWTSVGQVLYEFLSRFLVNKS